MPIDDVKKAYLKIRESQGNGKCAKCIIDAIIGEFDAQNGEGIEKTKVDRVLAITGSGKSEEFYSMVFPDYFFKDEQVGKTSRTMLYSAGEQCNYVNAMFLGRTNESLVNEARASGDVEVIHFNGNVYVPVWWVHSIGEIDEDQTLILDAKMISALIGNL
ncbi:MAG: hypothetical protein FWG30_11550 [Eubacteriaceae bacterium]|nr:hypothetical protein [Eubacteriaceae bacterium]